MTHLCMKESFGSYAGTYEEPRDNDIYTQQRSNIIRSGKIPCRPKLSVIAVVYIILLCTDISVAKYTLYDIVAMSVRGLALVVPGC